MRPRRLGGIVLLVPFTVFAVGAGCNALTDTTTTTDTTTVVGTPIIEIDPSVFLLGDVICADVPGAMRSYVVTFFDYGPPNPLDASDPSPAPGYPVALPSSEPTPCSQRVAFTNAVVGHRYVAEVDGYEQPATSLAAACSQKPEYSQCIADVTVSRKDTGVGRNGLCNTDDDCAGTSCQGKCVDADLQVEATDGTCQPIKDAPKVKACAFDTCTPPSAEKCVGSPKAKAPLGAGVCTKDADCFALGCYGQCKKEPLQWLDPSTNTCKTVLDASNHAVQAGVCLYTPVIGDRHMVTAGAAQAVSPRWTTPENLPCGYRAQLVAQEYARISISGCDPLDDNGGANATGVRVLPSATLGSLACYAEADGTGTITKFDVVPIDSSLAPKTGVTCNDETGAVYDQGVAPGQQYAFTVNAYENGQTVPTRKASCFATAKKSVIVLAKCDPLVAIP